MRKFQRAAEPEVLAENWVAWGEEWERRHAENSRAQFHWHVVNGKTVNEIILPSLKGQTQDHCSFCDNFPVSPPSIDTIEHFRPKSQYPREAYHWPNLYYCCAYCQQKGVRFDERALQPDALDYEFDRYFRWDFTTGEIKPKDTASPEDQVRAQATIDLYSLNIEHPTFRKRELRKRSQGRADPLDDFAYRGFVEGTG